jgi:hypothetical protein
MKYLGLHNKPKAAAHPDLLPMGPLEEEEEEEEEELCFVVRLVFLVG